MDIINTQPEEMPVHPWTGLPALGVLPSGRIVWPVLGGADDGDDDAEDGQGDDGDGDEQDDDGGDGGDDQDDADGGEDTKPADRRKSGGSVSRTELTKAIAARDRVKADLRAAKKELDELKRKSETAEETARREASEAAQKAADARYKPISVRAALLEAGVLPSRVKGALKLVDLEQVDIDEDGEVSGLDGQLEALKTDWPELFEAPKGDAKPEPKRPPSRGADGADRKPPSKKPPTASELQAAKLLGKTL